MQLKYPYGRNRPDRGNEQNRVIIWTVLECTFQQENERNIYIFLNIHLNYDVNVMKEGWNLNCNYPVYFYI